MEEKPEGNKCDFEFEEMTVFIGSQTEQFIVEIELTRLTIFPLEKD